MRVLSSRAVRSGVGREASGLMLGEPTFPKPLLEFFPLGLPFGAFFKHSTFFLKALLSFFSVVLFCQF